MNDVMSRNSDCDLRLFNSLKNGQTVFATFMLLKGARAAQVIANTGLDVSFMNDSLRNS